MSKKEYFVVFEGELIEGYDRTKLLNNLSNVYNKKEEEIEARLFTGDQVVIIRTEDKKEAKYFLKGFKNAGAQVYMNVEKSDTFLQKIQPFIESKRESLKYEPKHVEKRLWKLFVDETKKFIKSFKESKKKDFDVKKSDPSMQKIERFLYFKKRDENYKPQHAKGWSLLTIVVFLSVLIIITGTIFWNAKM